MTTEREAAKWDRILDRAAQIERQRIINLPTQSVMDYTTTPQSKAPAKISAAARWSAAIESGVARGLPKAKAIASANRDNPGLREAMLSEVNGRSVKPVASARTTSRALMQWKAAVNRLIDGGMPSAKAVMQIDRESPGLREAMLKEVNAR